MASTVLLGALVLSSCATDPGEAVDASSEVATDSAAIAPEPAADTAVAVPDLLDFSSVTVAGDTFDGASVAGRPTVFWFWAPWCATCRAQISGVGDLAGQFGDDVAVVGVGALDDSEAIEEFAGTVSSDVTLLSDPDGAVWRHFGVTAQSTYLVLDAAGEPQASGFLDGEDLVSTVSSLVTG
jgi:thiol-disulfide isomerase/thioredoxin